MQDALKQLEELCPHLIHDERSLKVYESDGLTAKREMPWCVALPETVAEIQNVMAFCHKHAIPELLAAQAPVCPGALCLMPKGFC